MTPATGPLHRCSRCGEVKPIDHFRLDSAGRVRAHCIACSLIDTAEWQARHRTRLLTARRAVYAALRADGLTPAQASARR